jgi:DDE domain/Transposase
MSLLVVWRVDETSIKIKGGWMYRYRAVDSQGKAIEFFGTAETRCCETASPKSWKSREIVLLCAGKGNSVVVSGNHVKSTESFLQTKKQRRGTGGRIVLTGKIFREAMRPTRISNGFVEGKNNRTKALMHQAYGYRNFLNLRLRILVGGEW